MLHEHLDKTDLCSPVLLRSMVPFCMYLIAFSPHLSVLKAVWKVMGKAEEEVLHKTDWETADFNTPELCKCLLGESALIFNIGWSAGLGSCSLLHLARTFCGEDCVRAESAWSSGLYRALFLFLSLNFFLQPLMFGFYMPYDKSRATVNGLL